MRSAREDDASTLAEFIARSSLADRSVEKPLSSLMIDVAESVPALADKRAAGVTGPELNEALIAAAEAGSSLRQFRDSLVAVAEAGQMENMLRALRSAAGAPADVDTMRHALGRVMEATL